MDRLPEELINKICGTFSPSSLKVLGKKYVANKKTLYNLMCVSRVFYRAARPLLYHTMTFGSDPWDTELKHFLDLCAKYPDTPKLVKVLHVRDWQADDGWREQNPTLACDPESLHMDSLLAVVDTLSISADLRADIRKGLRGGDKDAMITLLLAQCVHLESLIAEPDDWEGTLSIRLAEEAAIQSEEPGSVTSSAEKPFQLLKFFSTRHWDDENGATFRSIMPFFRLPAMETFTGTQVLFQGDTSFVSPALKLSLKYLDLCDGSIDARNLSMLLTVCPDLREVDVEFGSELITHVIPDYRGYGKALRDHGSRLQRLRIVPSSESWQLYLSHHVLGDLTTMRELHTLHVAWEALVGEYVTRDGDSTHTASPNYLAETLPASLEEFQILDTPLNNDDHIPYLDAQLLAMIAGVKFPKLDLIMVKRNEPFSLPLPPGWQTSLLDPGPCLQDITEIGMEVRRGWMRLDKIESPS